MACVIAWGTNIFTVSNWFTLLEPKVGVGWVPWTYWTLVTAYELWHLQCCLDLAEESDMSGPAGIGCPRWVHPIPQTEHHVMPPWFPKARTTLLRSKNISLLIERLQSKKCKQMFWFAGQSFCLENLSRLFIKTHGVCLSYFWEEICRELGASSQFFFAVPWIKISVNHVG